MDDGTLALGTIIGILMGIFFMWVVFSGHIAETDNTLIELGCAQYDAVSGKLVYGPVKK